MSESTFISLDELRRSHDALHKACDVAIDKAARLQEQCDAKDALIAKLRDVLVSIEEYWNGAEGSAADAAEEMRERAREGIFLTPETAAAELAELQKDRERFTELAEALADTNIGDVDPTQYFQDEGNWAEAWRTALDAARASQPPKEGRT